MAISYTWDVKTCDTYPSHTDSQDPANTESDVVYNVHWRLTAEDDANQDAEGNNWTASVYGTQNLDVDDLSSFTAWGSLSASTILFNAIKSVSIRPFCFSNEISIDLMALLIMSSKLKISNFSSGVPLSEMVF